MAQLFLFVLVAGVILYGTVAGTSAVTGCECHTVKDEEFINIRRNILGTRVQVHLKKSDTFEVVKDILTSKGIPEKVEQHFFTIHGLKPGQTIPDEKYDTIKEFTFIGPTTRTDTRDVTGTASAANPSSDAKINGTTNSLGISHSKIAPYHLFYYLLESLTSDDKDE